LTGDQWRSQPKNLWG